MKKMTSTLILGSVLAASCLMSGAAMAGKLTGNVGVMSDYFFRGIDAGSSATANAGVDYDLGNKVTVGAWGADVGNGLEVDLYGAYTDKINQFDYSIGFTAYQYTSDLIDNASEINLNVSTGPVNLEYSAGSVDSSPSTDYTFLALTFTQGKIYGTYGTFGSDIDGSYIEVGYGRKMNGADVGVALINSDTDLAARYGSPDSEISMVMNIKKSFKL